MTTPSAPLEAILTRMQAAAATPSAERDAARAAAARATRQATIQDLKAGWDAPTRHDKAKIDKSGPWGELLDALIKRLGTGFTVVLFGTNGSGKTQLAVELMRHQIEHRLKSAKFTTSMDFFMQVKATYRQDSKISEEVVVSAHSKAALLVVDETEKRSESPWENNLLFHLGNRRYNDGKDTVLISNLEREELTAHLGRSLVSRLNETGGMIHCDWPSRR